MHYVYKSIVMINLSASRRTWQSRKRAPVILIGHLVKMMHTLKYSRIIPDCSYPLILQWLAILGCFMLIPINYFYPIYKNYIGVVEHGIIDSKHYEYSIFIFARDKKILRTRKSSKHHILEIFSQFRCYRSVFQNFIKVIYYMLYFT